MRFLPTRIHGAVDYLWGLALIAVPFLFGWQSGSAPWWVAIVFGAGAIFYSLVTDYELGVVRLLPMSLHLVFDGVAGALLAVSPWLLGFAATTRWPFVIFGLVSIVASLVTRTQPVR